VVTCYARDIILNGYLLGRGQTNPGILAKMLNLSRHVLDFNPNRSDLKHQCVSILDAIRMKTGELVALKRVYHFENSQEFKIGNFFSEDSLASDPQNHCVPIQEIMEVPTHLYNGISLIVMPFLRRPDDPPFLTIGEAVEFFRQVFEVCKLVTLRGNFIFSIFVIQLFQGLQFMHKHNIAHRFVLHCSCIN
jgi:hypothetical protein